MIDSKWVRAAGMALAILVGCEAEHADPLPPIVPGKDTGAGEDAASGDAAQPGDTAGAPDGTDPADGGAGLTCEELSLEFVEELAKHAPSYDGCTKASDCTLIDPKIECKNALGQVVTTLVECPVAVKSPPLEFAEATLTIQETLCPKAPEGCVATPGCAPIEEDPVCEAGRCKVKLAPP